MNRMTRIVRGGAAALSLALLASTILAVAPGAVSATSHRAWNAKIGSAGANGVAAIYTYPGGIGAISLNLRKLPVSTSLTVTLYRGTCASVGPVLLKFSAIKSNRTGKASRTSTLTATQARVLYAMTGRFAIRVAKGSFVKCGLFAALAGSSPDCTSSAGFSYQAGACVTGSGKADIGPFTPPGPWSVSLQLSGKANSGDDCASTTIGVVLEARGAAGSEIAAGFGPAMSAQFSANLAPLHLILDPSGCSWTATFGATPTPSPTPSPTPVSSPPPGTGGISQLQPFVPAAIWGTCTSYTTGLPASAIIGVHCTYAGLDDAWYDLYRSNADLQAVIQNDIARTNSVAANGTLTCAAGNGNVYTTWEYSGQAVNPNQLMLCYKGNNGAAWIEQADPSTNVIFTAGLVSGNLAALYEWWHTHDTVVEPGH